MVQRFAEALVTAMTGTASPTWSFWSPSLPAKTWCEGKPWARAFSTTVRGRYSHSSMSKFAAGRAR
jgi:hypothetical protein